MSEPTTNAQMIDVMNTTIGVMQDNQAQTVAAVAALYGHNTDENAHGINEDGSAFNEAINDIVESAAEGGNASLPVGLVACVATSTIPAGWLRYGTGTTLTGCNAAYPDFYAYVVAGGNTCTLSAYETMLGLTGQCGAFGLDADAGTVRMPTVKFVQNALGDEVVGTVNEAGLPNIEGDSYFSSSAYVTPTGAVCYQDNTDAVGWSYGSSNLRSFALDASLYNDIYGNSDTVQPDSVLHFYIIHAYNAAVSASVAQAAEFVEMLEGKADVNTPVLSSDAYVVSSYSNSDGTTRYRTWSDGFIEQWFYRETSALGSPATVTFPTPFTTASSVNVQISFGGTGRAAGNFGGAYIQAMNVTTTNFLSDVAANTSGFGQKFYYATGY